MLGSGNALLSLKTLPAKLKYDYNRRVIARELSKPSVPMAPAMRQLPADVLEATVSGLEFNVEMLKVLVLELQWCKDEIEIVLMVSFADDKKQLNEESEELVSTSTQTAIFKDAVQAIDASIQVISSLQSSASSSPLDIQEDQMRGIVTCLPSLRQLLEARSMPNQHRWRRLISVLEIIQNTTFASSVPQISSISSAAFTEQDADLSGFTSIKTSDSFAVNTMPAATELPAKKKTMTFQQFLKEQEERKASEFASNDFEFSEDLSQDAMQASEVDVDNFVTNVDEEIIYDTTFVSSSIPSSFTEVESNESSEVPIVVDTTAIEEVSKGDRTIQMLVTGIDVTFFLLESLFKAVGPILAGGGALFVRRVMQTLDYSTVRVPFSQWAAARARQLEINDGKGDKRMIYRTSEEWELLQGFYRTAGARRA